MNDQEKKKSVSELEDKIIKAETDHYDRKIAELELRKKFEDEYFQKWYAAISKRAGVIVNKDNIDTIDLPDMPDEI